MGEKVLMKGNEALAEAAIQAGCRFYAGYPITPQSEVSEYMSRRMHEVGGVFIPAESEIAAINMVLGAGATGALVMTSSSSCAISLKQETLGYMMAQEVPCLLANVSRGGPGLGSISPSQGDYFQTTRTGANGDVRMPVFGPSTIQEMVDLVQDAFYLGQKYRTPVAILSDGMIGQMAEPIEFTPKEFPELPEREWILSGAKDRKPRKLSSIHLKEGELEEHVLHLFEKFEKIRAEEVRYEALHLEDAELVVIAFGSCARIAKTAIKEARKEGLKVGMIRPITLWPFPAKMVNETSKRIKNFLCIEMNMGQMYEDIKMDIESDAKLDFYGRPGGAIPTPEELLEQIKNSMRQVSKV
jgi:2-oxoglutarate ferredoxin oxidoreductase subunit alpha